MMKNLTKLKLSQSRIILITIFAFTLLFPTISSAYNYLKDPKFDLEKFLFDPGDSISSEKLAAINAKERGATVKITIYHTKTERLDSVATGTFISSTGHILTNYHVIMDSLDDSYHPHFELSDGTIVKDYEDIECNKVGGDICLLKIKATPKYFFNPNDMPSSAPASGEKLYMVGYPDMLLEIKAGVSRGVIEPLKQTGSNRLKVTVPIRPGFSGAPVFDSSSRLVCIASTRYYIDEIVNGNMMPKKNSLEYSCITSEIIRPILIRAGLIK